MTQNTALRAGLAYLIFVLGSLQAWDSNVHQAGLLILLLASLAIPLMPIALLIPIRQQYMMGALALSFVLLILARLLSPVPLPGIFLILVPAVMGLIFSGILKQEG